MSMFFSRYCSCLKCSQANRSSTNQPSVVEEFRIILLGRTGHGKSSLGNTLVGNKTAFKTSNRAVSANKRCKCVTRTFDNNRRLISVVDTPGFFDTHNTNVFTNIDRLENNETLDDYLNLNSSNPNDTNQDLVELINNCGRRYYGVNNKETNKRRNTRVLMDLIEKIRMMLINNGTSYYRSEIVTSIAIAYQKNMEVCKLSNLDDDDDDDDSSDLPNEFTNIIENAINS